MIPIPHTPPADGWTRRQLLAGSTALAASLGLPRAARGADASRKLIIWWNNGGWDPTFVFDPHFESSNTERDPFSTAATAGGIDFADAESRPSVRAFFERWGSKSCVINGLSVGSISHDGCSRLMLTGMRADASDIGTLVATQAVGTCPLPFISLGGPRYPGLHGEVLTPLGPVLAGFVQDTEPEGVELDAAREELLLDYMGVEARERGAGQGTQPHLDTWAEAVDRLRELRQHPELLDISTASTDQDLVEVGVSLLSAGLCAVVGMRAPLPRLVRWDSHNNNQWHQELAFESSFAELDALLSSLAAAEDEEGSLLDRTTVLVLSEMGRTPRLNGQAGKDHWPYTSAMIVGGGVGGGRIVGATSDALVGQEIDLSTGEASSSGSVLFPQNLLAGVLQDFGMDSELPLPGVKPFTAWRG